MIDSLEPDRTADDKNLKTHRPAPLTKDHEISTKLSLFPAKGKLFSKI